MAAGISSKSLYSRLYRRLNKMAYEVIRAGGKAFYKDREINGIFNGRSFRVYFCGLWASNGESCHYPWIIIDGKPAFSDNKAAIWSNKGLMDFLKEVSP